MLKQKNVKKLGILCTLEDHGFRGNKKAYYFTLDALFALALLVGVIAMIPYTSVSTLEHHYRMSYLQEDALNILSSVRSSEVNNVNISDIVNDSAYNTTLSQGDMLIESISKLWATNSTPGRGDVEGQRFDDAVNITLSFFGNVFDDTDNVGIFLTSGGTTARVANWNNTPMEGSYDTAATSGFISGIAQGESVQGNTARAFIQKKDRTKLVYFGGYIGDGNITALVELPQNVTYINNITLEIANNIPCKLYIYNATNGWLYLMNIGSAQDEFTPNIIYLSEDNFSKFVNGTNFLKFINSSDRLSISGGYIKVDYRTENPEFTLSKRQYLHQVEGVINEYDSIFAPDTINSMSIHLHYKINLSELEEGNATIVLTLGNATVYNHTTEDDIDDFSVTLNNATIAGNLTPYGNSYGPISNKTVPIRLGFREMSGSGGSGNADVALITDVSGSMAYMNIPCSSVWQISNQAYEGTYGAENQDINDSQIVCMGRTINVINNGNNNCNSAGSSKCNLSFAWKNSSQANDRLKLYIDGDYGGISNNPENGVTAYIEGVGGSWYMQNISIKKGSHNIVFCYDKNGSGSLGNDMGYIDNISIVNSTGKVTLVDDFEDGDLNGWNFFCGTEKLALAKDVDKLFVETVLNVTGNQIGLTAYSDGNPGVKKWMQLTSNEVALDTHINTYVTYSATCVSCGIKNATEIVNRGTPGKFKGMLIMTDGLANRCLPGDSTCGDNGEGYDSNAGGQATNWSCYARNATNNITVFAVGFGSDVDTEQIRRMACWNCTACPNSKNATIPPDNSICWIQNVTLPNGTIVKCLDTRWAVSDDIEELKRIYQQFGEWMVGLGFSEQRVNLTGNFSSVLYNDSYIDYDYTFNPCKGGICGGISPDALNKFGSLVTYESLPFRNSVTNFSFSFGIPLDIAVTSYSGPKWTKNVSIENTTAGSKKIVYELNEYGSNYATLGDPFHVNIPVEYVATDLFNNRVELKIANATNISNASDSDKVIYTLLLLSNYSYSNITPKADGCVWDIEYQEGPTSSPKIALGVHIPPEYEGDNHCYYNSTFRNSPPQGYICVNATNPSGDNLVRDDAIVQATYILFRNQLDKNPSDCILDLNVEQYYVNSFLLPSVPFLQYTKAEVLSWR